MAEVARERGHQVQVFGSAENQDARQLTPEHLAACDVVIDFTIPSAVLPNIAACVKERKAMVVGTTGWYAGLDEVKRMVEREQTGFVFAANFSYGVNLFFRIVQSAASALDHGYEGTIREVHHIHKKDAPSGTAIAIQKILADHSAATDVQITSAREGDVPGTHTLELQSAGDRIVLTHEAKSRRTFAEGAVLAAEWIVGRTGFYDFKSIIEQL